MNDEVEKPEDDTSSINPIEDIAALLSGEQPEDEPEQDESEVVAEESDEGENLEPDEDEAESEDEEVEPFNLNDLAEKLEVDKADLYSVEVPIGDGVAVTLGELKDAYKDVEAINSERDKLESERVTSQNEMMAARDQLHTLVGLLGDVDPAFFEQVDKIQQAEMQKAGDGILSAIPDWKDPAVVKADMAQMVDHLTPYGFSENDLGRVLDPRLMVYVRDNMRRERLAKDAKNRIAKRKKAPKNLKASSKSHARSAAQARLHKAAKGGDKNAQNALVADLLGG